MDLIVVASLMLSAASIALCIASARLRRDINERIDRLYGERR